MLNKQEKAKLTALFAETWKDEKMVKYEVNNTLSAFDLRGKTITIEKRKSRQISVLATLSADTTRGTMTTQTEWRNMHRKIQCTL